MMVAVLTVLAALSFVSGLLLGSVCGEWFGCRRDHVPRDVAAIVERVARAHVEPAAHQMQLTQAVAVERIVTASLVPTRRGSR